MIEILDRNLLVPQNKDYLEVARYLGYSKTEILEMDKIQSCCNKLLKDISPFAVFEKFDLEVQKENHLISFYNEKIYSKNLSENLEECKWVYLLAATIGPKTDFLIRKSQIQDPVMAAIFHCAGAMFVEKTVDYVNEKIIKIENGNGNKCKPRFSPGYGDLSLEVQKIFFKILPCAKIGLSLMDSLIMAPEKSVTAFIGVK